MAGALTVAEMSLIICCYLAVPALLFASVFAEKVS
jgi:hypothetical protein